MTVFRAGRCTLFILQVIKFLIIQTQSSEFLKYDLEYPKD